MRMSAGASSCIRPRPTSAKCATASRAAPTPTKAVKSNITSIRGLNLSFAGFTAGFHCCSWTLGLYGRNAFDEEYANAKLLPDDYLLIILNNDRSEFGLRYILNFGG